MTELLTDDDLISIRNHWVAKNWNIDVPALDAIDMFRAVERAVIERLSAGAEPVAVVGNTYQLFWIGSGPIAPLIGRLNIKPGDHLYTRPAPVRGAVGGMIDVTDRFPENDDPVLVYTPGNEYLQYAIDQWRMQSEAPVSFSSATIDVGFGWCDHDHEEVTHWMPLPTMTTQEAGR